MCVRCLAAINRRLWVGLADGRIRVVTLKPGPVAVGEEWLAHEAGVIALAPARSRVVSMAADGSIRAWSVAVGCPQEQLARQAFQPPAKLHTRNDNSALCIVDDPQGQLQRALPLESLMCTWSSLQQCNLQSLTVCKMCCRRPFSYQARLAPAGGGMWRRRLTLWRGTPLKWPP